MSSIEKFMDQLQKAEQEHGKQESDNSSQSPEVQVSNKRNAYKNDFTETENINLDRLKARGILTPDQGASDLADQYRAIKRILIKNVSESKFVHDANTNTIMVTSALPNEGKSFTAISLALSMSMEKDYTVLLVESDLHKPSITSYLGVETNRPGLSDYLEAEGANLKDFIINTNIPKFSFLPAGTRRENVAELIGSQNMRSFVDKVSTRYSDRIIIFDSPPLLLTSDSATLSHLVGQIVLVIEAGVTLQSNVMEACQLLDKDKPVGVVLNKNKQRSGGYGGYGYYGTK